MSRRNNYPKEKARAASVDAAVSAADDVHAVASLTTDEAARKHRRALDMETLQEIQRADIPAGVRGYVDQAMAWLLANEKAVLGGRQREVFEGQVKKLRAGLRLVDRVVGKGQARHITTRSTLAQERGREEKLRERTSMVVNTPWMSDPKLLPMRPPGKS